MHDLPPEGGRWTRSIKTGCMLIKTWTFVLVSRLGVMPRTSVAACSLFRLPDDGEAATTLTSRTHSLCTIHNLLDSATLYAICRDGPEKKKMAATLEVHKWHTWNVDVRLVKGFHEHFHEHYRVLPWAMRLLNLLESIAEVPVASPNDIRYSEELRNPFWSGSTIPNAAPLG